MFFLWSHTVPAVPPELELELESWESSCQACYGEVMETSSGIPGSETKRSSCVSVSCMRVCGSLYTCQVAPVQPWYSIGTTNALLQPWYDNGWVQSWYDNGLV